MRVLGLVGLLGVVGYMTTPATAFGLRGQPLLFEENIRYVFPPVVLGLLIGVILFHRWSLVAAVVLAVCGFASSAVPSWPLGSKYKATKGLIVLGAAVVLGFGAWRVSSIAALRRPLAFGLLLLVVAGGYFVQDA